MADVDEEDVAGAFGEGLEVSHAAVAYAPTAACRRHWRHHHLCVDAVSICAYGHDYIAPASFPRRRDFFQYGCLALIPSGLSAKQGYQTVRQSAIWLKYAQKGIESQSCAIDEDSAGQSAVGHNAEAVARLSSEIESCA